MALNLPVHGLGADTENVGDFEDRVILFEEVSDLLCCCHRLSRYLRTLELVNHLFQNSFPQAC